MTFRMTSHTECTGPLSGMCFVGGLVGSFGLDERKKWPPALLHAHGSDMKDASESMYRVMPDAVYLITACRCMAA
eukprot:6490874-Ditylum_brightwellii.AAC.1